MIAKSRGKVVSDFTGSRAESRRVAQSRVRDFIPRLFATITKDRSTMGENTYVGILATFCLELIVDMTHAQALLQHVGWMYQERSCRHAATRLGKPRGCVGWLASNCNASAKCESRVESHRVAQSRTESRSKSR